MIARSPVTSKMKFIEFVSIFLNLMSFNKKLNKKLSKQRYVLPTIVINNTLNNCVFVREFS